MKRLFAASTVIACMLMGGAAFAKDHDRDDHRGKGHERNAHYREARWDRDHDGDHDRRPPGWDKGKKKGWGDCDLPPGQAKKHGCYDRDRRYHRHRRPVVTRRAPTTTVRPAPRPVEGVWRRNQRTRTTPTVTQQTTTTTTTTQPGTTASKGTWRK